MLGRGAGGVSPRQTRGIELTIVSKTLRHSTVSTTANIYEHLTRPAARQAVNAIATGLDHAERRYDLKPTCAARAAPASTARQPE
ncbi:integrase [Streptacidiphilus sp. MAP12-20]|uniref:hypothetical protein n=1 Tax=Streptacidiphilus sp. MAP12-20 TaxID=3156299 RepID=UPI0035180202